MIRPTAETEACGASATSGNGLQEAVGAKRHADKMHPLYTALKVLSWPWWSTIWWAVCAPGLPGLYRDLLSKKWTQVNQQQQQQKDKNKIKTTNTHTQKHPYIWIEAKPQRVTFSNMETTIFEE